MQDLRSHQLEFTSPQPTVHFPCVPENMENVRFLLFNQLLTKKSGWILWHHHCWQHHKTTKSQFKKLNFNI